MTPLSECPQCHANIAPLQDSHVSLHFCPQCRFPLLLIAGKYRLIRELASGGFGQVFLARNIHLERDAERAIKLVKPELFQRPRMLERFRREVELTASISQYNPHIVRIFDDFGEHPTLGYFYVMEYLRGHPLDEFLLQHRSRLPLSVTIHIFVQLCQAMTTAHQAEIVHRDLKPSNIFVVKVNEDPHFVKVLDFGAAKPLDAEGSDGEELTQGLLGTPAYMSPEQCLHASVDQRSDIYAMGLILSQMLTGRHPYMQHPTHPKQGVQALLDAHKHTQAPTLHELLPEVPWPLALEECIQKALHKDPHQRFATAKALGESLVAATRDWALSEDLDKLQVKLPNLKVLQSYHTSMEHTAQMQVLPTRGTLPGTPQETRVATSSQQPSPSLSSRVFLGGEQPNSQLALRLSLVVLLGLLGLLWVWRSGRPPKKKNIDTALLHNRPLQRTRKRTTKPKPRASERKRQLCKEGDTQPCYPGEDSTRNVGLCKAGQQTCNQNAWGACQGAILPTTERCNNKDDDCDGSIDEDFPKKGTSCARKLGTCVFRGQWRCASQGTQPLVCDQTKARPRPGRTFHVLRIFPSQRSFHLTAQGRSLGKVRRQTCLELQGSPLVSLRARGYDTCTFALRRRPRRRTQRYRLYMRKRQKGGLLGLSPQLCLRKPR